MKGVQVIDHPLVQARLTRLRDEHTPHPEFRRLLGEIAGPLVYEATRNLELKPFRLRTPLVAVTGVALQREVLLVPVLRAGLGMLDGALGLLPNARVGCIGLRRNEKTLEAEGYLESLPPRLNRCDVLGLDPMLATGGSAIAAAKLLRERGARELVFVHVLAAPEGVKALRRAVPGVRIVTAALDDGLDSRGYILPGLGDAGDRCFGC